ncbi:hypothetical protein SALBM311S_00221 [Streptomyces alboniger]
MDVRELVAWPDQDGHRSNSYYRDVQHPYQADATAELVQRGVYSPRNTTGRHDEWGAAFDPRDFYDYRWDRPRLFRRWSSASRGRRSRSVSSSG